MSADDWKWSLKEATNVTLDAIWQDIVGDKWFRNKLINNFNVSECIHEDSGSKLSYLCTKSDFDFNSVILIHGSPGSALSWYPYLEFPGSVHFISIDRPGYGPVGFVKPDLERDIIILDSLIKYLSRNKKVTLVGHSMGGGIATSLALQNLDKIKGLLLIGTSLDPDLEKVMPIQLAVAKRPLKWLLTRSVLSSNTELLQYKRFLKNLQPHLTRLTCPVSIIHSKDDFLVPYKNIEYMRDNFINASILNIIGLDKGGHFINLDQPELLKRTLNDFT